MILPVHIGYVWLVRIIGANCIIPGIASVVIAIRSTEAPPRISLLHGTGAVIIGISVTISLRTAVLCSIAESAIIAVVSGEKSAARLLCGSVFVSERHCNALRGSLFFAGSSTVRIFLFKPQDYLKQVSVDINFHRTALQLCKAFGYGQAKAASFRITGIIASYKTFRKLFRSYRQFCC